MDNPAFDSPASGLPSHGGGRNFARDTSAGHTDGKPSPREDKAATSSSPLCLTKRRHANNSPESRGPDSGNNDESGAQYGSTSDLEKLPHGAGGEKVLLKRRVGLVGGVALIVGSIIGSGIFVSPGRLLERSGSVSVGLIIWVLCGVLSLLGALAYAELGAIIPKNGGEYAYFYEGLHELHPYFGPLPGFIFIWVNTILLKPSSFAILTLTFSTYLLTPIWSELVEPDYEHEDFPQASKWANSFVAIACVGFITFVNCVDVQLASRIQIVFTVAKVASMGLIIVGGIVQVAGGSRPDLAPDFNETASIGGLANAFYGGLWAYDGWNQLNFVAEEVDNPYVNLPRAIMIAMPVVIVCYVLVNMAYLSVMTAEEIMKSSAVAVEFGGRVLGKNFVWVMPLIVAISTYGSANGSAFAAGRLPYTAAKNDQFPEFIGYVNVKSLAPAPALLLNGFLAILLIMAGEISELIDFFSFTAWIFYGGSMIMVILLRFKRKDLERPYKVNLAIPVVVALISVYLVIGPIVDDPRVEYLYAVGFIVLGVPVYTYFVYYEGNLPGMRGLTRWIQKIMNVVPTDSS